MQIVRQREFVNDLTGVYAYLAARSPRAADRLLDEVEALISLLSVFPELGRDREELGAGVRSSRIRRFRQTLYYRKTDQAVILLRLLHSARNISPDIIGD